MAVCNGSGEGNVSPGLTRMLARMSSSLTAAGPTCLISMRATLVEPSWAQAAGASAHSSQSPKRRHNNFIVARSLRHVFVAYFGCAFKSCIGFQERKINIARWTITLFGDQQIHRQRVLFGRRIAAAIFIVAIARLV